MKLTISEKLSYSTVRIECTFSNGGIGTGTGFFFNFSENKETGEHIPVIITNKHVVSGAIKGRFIFTKASDNREPLDSQHLPIDFDNFEKQWVFHDSPDVDLCALPIGPLLSKLKQAKQKIFFIPLNKDLIPNAETIEDTTALEEILMIGYPNGFGTHIIINHY